MAYKAIGAGLGALLLALSSFSALAGDMGPMFRLLGVVDGLPDSRVEAMVQDQHGYVWIGTQSGLVRHEAHRLRRLSHDPDDPNALPGVNIMSLHAHSDGQVWAAISGQGVVEIGPDLKVVRHLQPSAAGGVLPDEPVWSMAEDCGGSLWLSFMRGGVARFDPVSEELTFFAQNEEFGLAEAGFQMQIHAAADCRVWLVQTERISVLPDPSALSFETVLSRDHDGGDAIFNAMHIRPDGTILIARLSELMRLESDFSTETVLVAETTISGFAEAGDGRLLMSSYRGLLNWDPATGQTEVLGSVEGLPDSLPSSSLYQVMVDREGGLWLSVFRNGVAYLPPGHEAFARFQAIPGQAEGMRLRQVTGIAPGDSESRLWLAGPGHGIERIDLDSGEVRTAADLFQQPRFDEFDRMRFVHQVGDRLVFGWSREIWMYQPSLDEFTLLLEREQVDQGTFSTVHVEDQSHIWVSTFDAGLLRLNLDDGLRQHFHPEGEGRFAWPESIVNDIRQDRHGQWWVAGRETVYRLDEGGQLHPVVALEQGPVLAMAWDDDVLWLANDFHLERWRRHGEEMRRERQYPLSDSLRGGRVFSIFPRAEEQVWLVLSNGLARLDAVSGRFRPFSRADGLAAAEFLRNTPLGLDDGRLAIGSSNGMVLVQPNAVAGPRRSPPVHLTALTAGQREIALNPGSREEIVLDHRSNSITLDYVALSYLSPGQNRYRIRLQGWDEDWLEVVGQTRHFYSNLRPGRYRFQVQAATPEGLWNETGDELSLKIQEPPWLSRWALLFYGLLLAAGAGVGWRIWQQARQRRQEMLDARRKRALAEEQRQVLERLNRNLTPLDLARVIGEEILSITGGRYAWVAYEDEQLPGEPVAVGDALAPLSREEWETRLGRPYAEQGLLIDLRAEDAVVARCSVDAGPEGFVPEHQERLDLLVQMAGQALHNLLLIERVRALAERAEQASAAKSEFLATMSHEIRTPLHGVMGMVELLYETESNPGQQDLLSTLHQSGRQLQRIIDDVLDISRIEAGRLSLEYQHFELPSLLEQVVDLHAPNAARKNLDLRLRLATDLPVLAYGDPGRISQVLGNLLNNAVKFTETGGIEVAAECGHDGQLRLSVADSGPGIAPDDRARLFEPFMQLDASITRSHSGSGLGLAICRRLVAAMEGELSLADCDQGGSRFELRLPVLVPADPGPRMSQLLSACRVAAWLDAPTLRVLRRIGRRWGFAVIDARRSPPSGCEVLLVRESTVSAEGGLRQWAERVEHRVVLDVPFRRAETTLPAIDDEHLLRWPLVESRLVGLLFDQALIRSALMSRR